MQKFFILFMTISVLLLLVVNTQHVKDTYDPCFDSKTGIAQRCVPNFENIAYGKIVQASSTCGEQSMNYCINNSPYRRVYQQTTNKYCDICDNRISNSIRDSKYLTDLEESNLTCWVSAPVQDPTNTDISLSVSFGKKFELTYISLQFCTDLKPDSIAIMKSMDYGKTWIPFQYYSSDCKKVYNKQLKAKITQSNEQEAICTDSHLQSIMANTNRIGFSVLEGRPSFHEFDTSPVLQDWVTATDIKIIINRLMAPQVKTDFIDFLQIKRNQTKRLSSSLTSARSISQPTETINNFASLSEIAIGGRCKCNGHASRCILGRDGKYKCDCKHNTAGLECERCLPFHYDRPWARGTPRDANECITCNCNNHSKHCRFNLELYRLSGNKSGGMCNNCEHNTAGRNCHYCKSGFYRDQYLPITSINACKACNCNSHSRRCRFNKELYLLSGRKSGGVCVNCKHNTAGRYCHYCREGFYRNSEVPIAHKEACKECDCHFIGASSKVCNQSNGQCECKEGVTGLRCDRCMRGYQQTNSATSPCMKITTTTSTTTTTTTTTTTSTTTTTPVFIRAYNLDKYPYLRNNGGLSLKEVYNSDEEYQNEVDDETCNVCKRKPLKVSFKDFCNYDYVFSVKIIDNSADSSDRTKEQDSKLVKFFTIIDRIYKLPSTIEAIKDDDAENGYYNLYEDEKIKRNQNIYLWFNKNEVTCKCPKMELDKKYLVMIKSSNLLNSIDQIKTHNEYDNSYDINYAAQQTDEPISTDKLLNLYMDENTFINEWKVVFMKRLRRFTRGLSKGKCA